ncbi:hypothetical protein [Roseomonas xinghualingensis]|uniref:hypothetical protein n=1 Tax=Roseomonas xinghualingensis TaxID=2986475 RepID=UPI0021F23020|nr:hypothetical protein [Roseomonas sp. SXEYE001]MCV4210007.1 hypothetical protein [Roseomonas sp. SXEYE001]
MRKPNYGQDRAQRERDKAAKAQAKEQKRLAQKEAKLGMPAEHQEGGPENGEERAE